jgi:RNA polymerase sigma-70 factor (ECF subfamily)
MVRRYTPLLWFWARRLGLQEHDVADLVQDVLIVLVQKLPEFQYQPGKSFRGWLRTVLMNKWRDRPRHGAAGPLDSDVQLLAPMENPVDEREYRLFVLGQALRIMSADFESTTWQACWETVVMGRPAAEVAAELGITANAVYLAKARVLGRLREELDEQLN